jgi:hypothetical protein
MQADNASSHNKMILSIRNLSIFIITYYATYNELIGMFS